MVTAVYTCSGTETKTPDIYSCRSSTDQPVHLWDLRGKLATAGFDSRLTLKEVYTWTDGQLEDRSGECLESHELDALLQAWKEHTWWRQKAEELQAELALA